MIEHSISHPATQTAKTRPLSIFMTNCCISEKDSRRHLVVKWARNDINWFVFIELVYAFAHSAYSISDARFLRVGRGWIQRIYTLVDLIFDGTEFRDASFAVPKYNDNGKYRYHAWTRKLLINRSFNRTPPYQYHRKSAGALPSKSTTI
jgi:hypothetical protein